MIHGTDCTPRPGWIIRPDDWRIYTELLPGDNFSPLRIRTLSGIVDSYACEVEVTGRTFKKDAGCRVVRCKITFVGDGEEDSETGGWLGVPFSDGTYC